MTDPLFAQEHSQPQTSGCLIGQPGNFLFLGSAKCYNYACMLDMFYDNLKATDDIYIIDENIKRLAPPPVSPHAVLKELKNWS